MEKEGRERKGESGREQEGREREGERAGERGGEKEGGGSFDFICLNLESWLELCFCMWCPKHLLLSMLHVLIWVLPRLCKLEGQGVSAVAVQHRMDVWLLHRQKKQHAGRHNMTLNKKWDRDREGSHPKWQEEEVYRWNLKKKKPKHGVAFFPLCIVSNWHIQETQIRLKHVISCECFKEVKIRKKMIGKHSSPPSVILHHSTLKNKCLSFRGGFTSMLLTAGKKQNKSTGVSTHAHPERWVREECDRPAVLH